MSNLIQNPKTLYKVVLNANTDNEEIAIIAGLDDCCRYVKAAYGEEIAVKKIMDDGILIKPAKGESLCR